MGEAEDGESQDEGAMEDVTSHRLLLEADASAVSSHPRRLFAERIRLGGTSTASPPPPLPLPLPRYHRGHRLSVTSTALRRDDCVAYSASKDGTVIEWDVETGRRLSQWKGGMGGGEEEGKGKGRKGGGGGRGKCEVLGLALSDDGRFLATGGADGNLRIFDTREGQRRSGGEEEEVHGNVTVNVNAKDVSVDGGGSPPLRRSVPPPLWCQFPAHRSSVNCLSFRLSSSHLFSGSADRTVKLFDVQAKAYVETLFGHSQSVTAIDSLYKNRAVSVGADRTARMWKVVEESQLLFRVEPSLSSPSAVSWDSVCLLDEEHFLTGGDDGAVQLWSTSKKKPLHVQASPHQKGHWICSLATIPFTDIAFSGSSDGAIQIYQWGAATSANPRHTPSSSSSSVRGLLLLGRLPCVGYVNSLNASHSGRFLLAGIGQEHRQGRWMDPIHSARNGIAIIPLLPHESSA